MSGPLVALATTCGHLGLLAVGGINSVVPELQRQVVGVRHWMDARQFAALFALAQAAPGPNLLVVTLIGWHVAGASGALVATGSVVGPTSLLTYTVSRFWHREGAGRWRDVLRAGLTPVTVGLVLAAAILLARSATQGVGSLALLLVVALLAFRGWSHPLWLLAGGAALGAFGLV